ncbi:MAG TPA: hypothetical protein VK790_02180 [Solirubrobacteraceae bacterium]|jgi:hypothetical protein|nr:hypothetical protein [Solirubrobacteraceae bacterium]
MSSSACASTRALGRWLRTSAARLAALALCAGPLAGVPPARAGTPYVDGISDQSLPAWDGSFSDSPFARFFRAAWVGQITLARYVVQWNAVTEASDGPNAHGDYRERLEAWLQDVRSLGVAPVLALTSYDHVDPASAGEYEQDLEATLAEAAEDGEPVGYVEAWNEPNGQGDASAGEAGAIANSADSVCARHGCRVIAGDLQDSPGAPGYEREYVDALNFAPQIWGMHPYYSVKAHSDTPAVTLVQALPDEGAGAQIWFTEVGAYDCAHGQARGEALQASDAAYLIDELMPAIEPEHVFYYGFMAGDRAEAPCAAGGGNDTELYRASGDSRGAATVILRSDGLAPPVLGSGLRDEQLAFASEPG